ncbi:MAG TPA: hypothetical protein VLM40_20575 [Gemmata sp.]|nr:hypothetical protein [Gemmata sp.]
MTRSIGRCIADARIASRTVEIGEEDSTCGTNEVQSTFTSGADGAAGAEAGIGTAQSQWMQPHAVRCSLAAGLSRS